MKAGSIAICILCGLGLIACTDTEVGIGGDYSQLQVDNQLMIHGEVCTTPPDDTEFPVKIMFIMDCSGSMQQTDEGDQRVEAVRQVVRRYANNPQIYFNVIKFNGLVADLTGGFVQLSGDEPEVFGPQGILEADSMTDYQGGLGVAYQVLLDDMQSVSNGAGGLPELSRSKYVIIFFSDGTPDPVCYGCVTDPPNHPRYLPPCDGYEPYELCCNEDLHVICQTMDQGVLTNVDMDFVNEWNQTHAAHEDYFRMMEGGADYNHNYQIFQLLDAIMELKETFHVGEMRFHTAFLYCRDEFGNPTSALCEAAEQAYSLDPDRGRALLREMARRGGGTFRDFTSGQDIDFLKIDYTSIKRTYAAKNLMVTNINAFPGTDHFLADSDGDGLDDDLEMRDGYDPLKPDSDDDGYQDFIEHRKLSAGFDPLRPDRPDVACTNNQDSDGDGLRYCEEALYGTDDKLVDSDADGFPDLYEIRLGTDPLRCDVAEDLDSDGQRNGNEMLFHCHPGRSDAEFCKDHRYWYELRESELKRVFGDVQCYTLDIRYISLVTTMDRSGPGTRGFNDILIWFDQSAHDDPFDPGRFRVACARAQYINPDYKIPPKGEIRLTDDDFVMPGDLDLDFTASSCVTAE